MHGSLWSSNHVSINLYETNIILYSDKKRKVPKAQLSPSKVQVLAEEADLSWWLSWGQVPRTYPAVIAEGARHPGSNWLSGSLGPPNGGAVLTDGFQADGRCH